MADKTIGGLPNAAALTDDSSFVCEDSGVAKRVTGKQIKDLARSGAVEAQLASEEAAAKALASENAAKASEIAAKSSEEAAKSSENAASNSASSASSSALSAETSAQTATQKSSEASASATNAAASAAAAANSESVAASSASSAADSAAAASTSETNAKTSETAAADSAKAAAASATAAEKAGHCVFVATYGETTCAEMEAAYQAGKLLVMRNGAVTANLYRRNNESLFVFSTVSSAFMCAWDNWTKNSLAFLPSKHASTHASGGDDPITPESIGAAPASHAEDTAIHLPTVTANDNGKLLCVVNGAWAAVSYPNAEDSTF